MPTDPTRALMTLGFRLGRIAASAGIDEPPQVDENHEATWDYLWFSRDPDRLVALTVAFDDTSHGYVVWMRRLDDSVGDSIDDPTDEDIADWLRWFATPARRRV